MRRRSAALHAALAGSTLLLLWPAWRQALEARMALHMLLQFPWLLACGASTFVLLGPRSRLAGLLARVDDGGLFTACLLLCVPALWMIPAALDLALLDGHVALAKYLSWYATGLLLASSAARLGPELRLFVLGNLVWMLATAGWLLREADTRLCVNYLADDQRWAGSGLVLLALGLVAGGVSGCVKRST